MADSVPPPAPFLDRTRVAIAPLVMAIGALLLAGWVASLAPRRVGEPGTQDFIEYWAAYQVAADGGNAYDPASLLAVQQGVGRADAVPLMMWNPPWLLVLMRPVLAAPFGEGATRWLACNLVLLAASVLLIVGGWRRRSPAALDGGDVMAAILGGVLSVPAVMTLQLGQVSLLLLLGVAALYWGLRCRSDLVAGGALALLSLKPHLFFLVVVLVAIVIVRERRWGMLAWGIGVLASLVALSVALAPTLPVDWYRSTVAPPAGAPPAITWRTPNLPNLLRELLPSPAGSAANWPLAAIPALAVLIGAVALWRRSRSAPGALDAWFPPVLAVSVITAPFGWTFDHVVLTVVQVLVFARALSSDTTRARRWAILAAALGVQVALIAQATTTHTDYFGFWWYPPAMLAVWWLSGAGSMNEPRPAAAG